MIANLFPETLHDLETELLIHSKDGRSDAGFRLNIALSQMGNLAAHFTHDPKENPVARPYGTPLSEKSDAGHAMVQLMTYCALRGIDLQEAVNMALVNLREKDFIKREVKKSDCDDIIVGQTAMTGIVRGKAWVIETDMIVAPKNYPSKEEGYILVASHTISDARLKRFVGIVTEHGGSNCHAAIIARESGIPCVVGTGNATSRIKDGSVIEINASVDQGQVKIV
jgi:phosphohistidine swiveling domain-containing protein